MKKPQFESCFMLHGDVLRQPRHSPGQNTVLCAGVPYSEEVLLNGVPLTPSQVTQVNWGISDPNLNAFGSVNYQASSGQVTQPNLNVYPLQVLFVPTVANLQLLPATTTSSGSCTVPPYIFTPPPNNFLVQTAGAALFQVASFGNPGFTTNPSNGNIGFGFYEGGEGCQINFKLVSNGAQTGNIAAFQLVKAACTGTFSNGAPLTYVTTNGEWLYDGNGFPYQGVPAVNVTGPGEFTYPFYDAPTWWLTDAMKTMQTLTYTAQFMTYFFFQNSTQGSAPCLLMRPICWAQSTTFAWSTTTSQWQIIGTPTVQSPILGGASNLPEWNGNIQAQPFAEEAGSKIVF